MKRVTIKDIAKALQLSPSTISRALKDHPDISEETRKRVKDLADELQYRPYDFAVNFRNKKSNTIGLIVPQVSMIYFPSLLEGVNQVLRKADYNLLILTSNETLENEKKNLEVCERNGVDGLLISVSKETTSIDHFKPLIEYKLPIVFLDRLPNDTNVNLVGVDDQEAARKGTTILLKKGIRKIAGLFGNANLSITQKRLEGFIQACKAFDLPNHAYSTFNCENAIDAEFKTRELLQFPPADRIEGLFSMSDEILIGVMKSVYAQKINIPDALSIICISDGAFPSFFNPPISYIQTSGYEIGKTAANQLLHLINSGAPIQKHLMVETPYIPRYSL